MSFSQEEIDRIHNKTDEEILLELVGDPDIFCSDVIYLIDYHLSMDIKDSMRNNLNELKAYIQTEQDGYIAEQILLRVLI